MFYKLSLFFASFNLYIYSSDVVLKNYKYVNLEFQDNLLDAITTDDAERVKQVLHRYRWLAKKEVYVDDYTSTPLCEAASKSCVRIVGILLDFGADVHRRDSLNMRPLHRACFVGKDDIVDLLLDRGAAVDVRDNYGYSPLHLACLNGSISSVQRLLDAKAYVNARNSFGQTPLHCAAVNGSSEIIELIVKAGADLKIADKVGRTPIIYAAQERNVDTVAAH